MICGRPILILAMFFAPAISVTSRPQKTVSSISDSIAGTWVLTTNDINYPTLEFNKDSSAVFTSRGDTVYRYRYFLRGAVIILNDGARQFTPVISLLTSDSLTISNLPGKKGVQRYYRRK